MKKEGIEIPITEDLTEETLEKAIIKVYSDMKAAGQHLCKKCRQWKTADQFFRKSPKNDGALRSECKPCKRARQNELYARKKSIAALVIG